MARNIRGDALAEWLDRDIPFLDGGNPLDELAAGGYERLIQLALGRHPQRLHVGRRDSSSAGQYLIKAVPNKSRLYFLSLAMTTETSIDVLAELGVLEPAEVAQLLKLRHSTVLDLSRRGVLPAFKIGKHWRYRRADLEEWMVRQRDVA